MSERWKGLLRGLPLVRREGGTPRGDTVTHTLASTGFIKLVPYAITSMLTKLGYINNAIPTS